MTEALKMFARSVLALIVLLLVLSLAIIAFDTEEPWHERIDTEKSSSSLEHLSE